MSAQGLRNSLSIPGYCPKVGARCRIRLSPLLFPISQRAEGNIKFFRELLLCHMQRPPNNRLARSTLCVFQLFWRHQRRVPLRKRKISLVVRSTLIAHGGVPFGQKLYDSAVGEACMSPSTGFRLFRRQLQLAWPGLDAGKRPNPPRHHGDNGASHQTGRTGAVAKMPEIFGQLDALTNLGGCG